jgi:hypothetical protein
MSKSYTYGTTPEDVIREALPHKYDMSLNREDMWTVLEALALLGENADLGIENAERAMSLRSAILSTLDIEEI